MRRESVPLNREHQDQGRRSDQSDHGRAKATEDTGENLAVLELSVKLNDSQNDHEGRQDHGKCRRQRTDDSDQMARAGLMQDLIADVGGAVDSDWARGHLRDGHDVGEGTFREPPMGHDNLSLDKGKHGVAATEREEPDDKEHPEKLEDKSKFSHYSASFLFLMTATLADTTIRTSRM